MVSKKNQQFPQGQIYGYLRVSTETQNLENNKHAIENKKKELGLIGPIEWIEEKVSGGIHWKSRELGKWLETAKAGEVLMISELSRISRTGIEIPEFISVALGKQIRIYSLDMPIPIDGSPMSLMYINAVAIGAQMERDNIRIRTKLSLDKLKAEGIILGRPKGVKNKNLKLDPFKEQIRKKILQGITLKRIANDYNVSQQTMCSYVKSNNLKNAII